MRTSSLALERLWASQLLLSRLLVMALNVATLGYFWFHEPLDADPKQSGRFWERLLNLETNQEIRADRKSPLRLEFGRPRVLERADLNRWITCFGHLLRINDAAKQEVCHRYLDGLAMIAKSDVHMAFEIQAVAAFYLALKAAMKAYGGLSDDEPFATALRRFVSEKFKTFDDADHLDRLIGIGESINKGPVPHAMNMNDVLVMKAICDVYLIHTFRKLDPPEEEAHTENRS